MLIEREKGRDRAGLKRRLNIGRQVELTRIDRQTDRLQRTLIKIERGRDRKPS